MESDLSFEESLKPATIKNTLPSLLVLFLLVIALVMIFFSDQVSREVRQLIIYEKRWVYSQRLQNLNEASKKFHLLWFDELSNAYLLNKLDHAFSNVSKIEISYYGDNAKIISENLIPPFDLNPSGNLHLDLFLSSWADPKADAVIVQQTFLDSKSKNFVTEVAHTFFLKGSLESYDNDPTPIQIRGTINRIKTGDK